MTLQLSDRDILAELEPTAEANLNDHLAKAKDWNPHDYVPWDEGRNFAEMGGIDWEPGQSRLSEVAKAAMITNLLTEDNLPSYHRELADTFGFDRRPSPGARFRRNRRTAPVKMTTAMIASMISGNHKASRGAPRSMTPCDTIVK